MLPSGRRTIRHVWARPAQTLPVVMPRWFRTPRRSKVARRPAFPILLGFVLVCALYNPPAAMAQTCPATGPVNCNGTFVSQGPTGNTNPAAYQITPAVGSGPVGLGGTTSQHALPRIRRRRRTSTPAPDLSTSTPGREARTGPMLGREAGVSTRSCGGPAMAVRPAPNPPASTPTDGASSRL